MKKPLLLIIAFVFATFGTVNLARAATLTWTGNYNDDWQEPLNWSGGVIPDVNDDIILPGSGANQNIINVQEGPYHSLSVLGGTYSLQGEDIITLTIAAGYDFSVSLGASLSTSNDVSLSVGGSTIISGTFLTDGNFTATGTTTVNAGGNMVLNGSFRPGADITCNGTLHLNGPYIVTSGTRTISGTGTVFIDATRTLTVRGNLSINTTNFTFSGSLSINTGKTLTRTGNMTANTGTATNILGTLNVTGNLVLETHCSLIQGLTSGVLNVTGTSTTKLSFSKDSVWHYFAIPTTVSHSAPLIGHYVMYYTESNYNWHYIIAPMPDSTWTAPALGYAIWPVNMTPISFVGTIVNGTIDEPVTRTLIGPPLNDYNGWNLVGNPYPSAINLLSVTGDWTNLQPWAWFWDPNFGNYRVFGTSPGPPYGTHSQYAPAMQGFFVKVTDVGNPSSGVFHLDNAHRSLNNEPFLKDETNPNDVLSIRVDGTSTGYSDEILVYFNPGASEGYDENFDALKLPGNQDAPQLSTTTPGYEFTVSGIPAVTNNGEVDMAFSSTLPGDYTLTASQMESFNPGVGIMLLDTKDNSTQDLRQFPVFSFTHDPANDPNRFKILFTDLLTGTNNIPADGNQIKIFAYNDFVYVTASSSSTSDGIVKVYDMLGREVYSARMEHSQINKYQVPSVEGYYLVQVTTDGKVAHEKVYIR